MKIELINPAKTRPVLNQLYGCMIVSKHTSKWNLLCSFTLEETKIQFEAIFFAEALLGVDGGPRKLYSKYPT